MQDPRGDKTQNSLENYITIELFGQPYTFKAEVDVSKAKEIADFLMQEVNKVQDQLSKTTGHMTKQTILILAALNIASENLELKKNHLAFLQKISERTTSLIQALDANAQ
jgi:cell division protein ZapA (FtsZ GTPase activity inhibitor)